MAYVVVKKGKNGALYGYLRESYRVGSKVKTRDVRYLGRVGPMTWWNSLTEREREVIKNFSDFVERAEVQKLHPHNWRQSADYKEQMQRTKGGRVPASSPQNRAKAAHMSLKVLVEREVHREAKINAPTDDDEVDLANRIETWDQKQEESIEEYNSNENAPKD